MESIVPGLAVRLWDDVLRITAANPGVMTGPGTNSYIVGTTDLALIDPGPEIAAHIEALVAAVGPRLKWILCTHTHMDHSPAARAVQRATGAQIGGLVCPQDGRQDADFAPDRLLHEGETVSLPGITLRALHTPGHASNHVCYLLDERKLLFTGDHIMQGSTVVISPPNGDMQAYLASLDKLLPMDIAALAPGHGRVIDKPHDEVRRLIAHRLSREAKVVDALARRHPANLEELVPLAYDDVSPRLYAAAQRSLHAHLIKLQRDGRAVEKGSAWEPVSNR